MKTKTTCGTSKIKQSNRQLLKFAEQHPFSVDVPTVTRDQLDNGSESYRLGFASLNKNADQNLRDAIKCLSVYFRRECRFGMFGFPDEHFESDDYKTFFTYIADYDAPVLITGFASFGTKQFNEKAVWEMSAGYMLPNTRKHGDFSELLMYAEHELDFFFVQPPISPSMKRVLESRKAKSYGELVYLGEFPDMNRCEGEAA